MTFPVRPFPMPIRRGWDDSSAPEAGPPQFSRRRGKVLSWDPFTMHNAIEVDGVTYEDIPCLNVIDSVTMMPNDRVEIITFSGLWYVLGRIVAPGTEDAERSIKYVQGVSAYESGGSGGPSTSYGDLSVGGFGPAVTFDVPPSGQVWVGISGHFSLSAVGGGTNNSVTQYMSFELSGANNLAPDDDWSIFATAAYSGSSTPGISYNASHSDEFFLTGLAPGATSFVAKYRSATSGTGTKASQVTHRRIRVKGA